MSVVDNVFVNRELKERESNIDVDNDSWVVRFGGVGSNKCYPVRMVYHANKGISLAIWRAGDRANRGPREFLDKDDVEGRIDF